MASAGKKKGKVKGKKLNLNEFLGSESSNAPGSSYVLSQKSWADASEDIDDNGGEWADDSYKKSMINRSSLPTAPRSAQPVEIDKSMLPDKPPYTVFIGNLPYDVEEDDIVDFFKGCNVTQVRLLRDGDGGRLKGFGYAEIGDMESLMAALKLSNENLRNRRIRVDLAGQQGDGNREDRSSDWRKRDGGGYGGRGGEDERAGRSEGSWDRPTASADSYDDGPSRGGFRDDRQYESRGGYNRDRGGGGFDRSDGDGYRDGYRDDRRYDNRGGYNRDRGSGGGYDRGYDRGYDGDGYRDNGYRNEYGNGGDRYYRDRGYDGYGSRDQGYNRDRYGGDRGYGGDSGYGGNRSYGRDRGYRNDRNFGRDQGYGRDGYERDRRGFDDQGSRGYGDRDGGYQDAPSSDEPVRERKKLVLKPRTQPVETPAAPKQPESKPSQSSIFGGAKPVDTAAKERQIEERLRREQESEKAEVEESRRNRQINRERPRRDSERSNDEGRTRHSSSSSTGKGPKPVMLRRESERSDDESKKDDQPLSPKSPTSPPPRKEDPSKVLVPAPAPKENVWARRSEGVTSPKSETAPAPTSNSSSSGQRKDYKPPQGRGRDRNDRDRNDRDRNDRNLSDRKPPHRDQTREIQKKTEKVRKPREIPKYEEKSAPDFTQKNKFAGLEQEDNLFEDD
ncbi:eukaryotic translation initiation factor 4B-like isoform X2 [Antedon mediterranea]|uniref:eukaryotic translation initiation factor 4B-like isoform X2 n=1 Tax=Antedon mediterranea TaxID=105859 RepID=UPI003AF839EA